MAVLAFLHGRAERVCHQAAGKRRRRQRPARMAMYGRGHHPRRPRRRPHRRLLSGALRSRSVPSKVIYDEYSSLAPKAPGRISIGTRFFKDATWFHFTGITASLGPAMETYARTRAPRRNGTAPR